MFPRGQRGSASCTSSGCHVLRACPMGTRGEGRRGRAATAAHRGAGGAGFRGLEPSMITREAGRPSQRCGVRQFPLRACQSAGGWQVTRVE